MVKEPNEIVGGISTVDIELSSSNSSKVDLGFHALGVDCRFNQLRSVSDCSLLVDNKEAVIHMPASWQKS